MEQLILLGSQFLIDKVSEFYGCSWVLLLKTTIIVKFNFVSPFILAFRLFSEINFCTWCEIFSETGDCDSISASMLVEIF